MNGISGKWYLIQNSKNKQIIIVVRILFSNEKNATKNKESNQKLMVSGKKL